MRRIESTDPNLLRYRGGGGALIFGGAFFLLFGIGLVASSAEAGPGPIFPGTLMVIIGLLLILGRSGAEFDLRSRTYRRWWGLLFPLRVKEGPLGDYEKVVLSSETRRTKNQNYTVYPVRLEGKARTLGFGAPRTYEVSRLQGEEIAKRLGLPLADRTSGVEVLREPDLLDESIRDRVRKEGLVLDLPDPPPGLRTLFEMDGKTIRFHLPRPGFSPRMLPLILPLIAFELVVLCIFFVPLARGLANEEGSLAGVAILAVVVGFAGVLPVLAVLFVIGRRLRGRTIVEASPALLRLRTGTERRERVLELPSDKIEDLEIRRLPDADRGIAAFLDGGAPITARSDERTLSFGGHLPPEEKLWMLQVLKQVLTA